MELMKHDDLLEQWEKDSQIDNVDLSKASRNTPKIHSKYLGILANHKAMRISLNHKDESLRKDLEIYYSGQATADVYKKRPFDLKLKSRAAIDKHVSTDPQIIAIRNKLEYIDVIIEASEYILKQISQQNFTIKNIIDFEKFRNGIV